MNAKTKYNDPTIAKEPPGGKHHEIEQKSRKLPIDRPDHQDFDGEKGRKTVDEDEVAKAKK